MMAMRRSEFAGVALPSNESVRQWLLLIENVLKGYFDLLDTLPKTPDFPHGYCFVDQEKADEVRRSAKERADGLLRAPPKRTPASVFNAVEKEVRITLSDPADLYSASLQGKELQKIKDIRNRVLGFSG